MKIDISKLNNPDYIGSVQKIYHLSEYPDYMACETTTGGSVFDVGTIFHIKNNDIYRAALRHKIYTDMGNRDEWLRLVGEYPQNLQTHHLGMVDSKTQDVIIGKFPENISNINIVKKFTVIKPDKIDIGETFLWDYSQIYKSKNFVIPLENIVRFGITPESSIYKKYKNMSEAEKEKFHLEYGVKSLQPWSYFPSPKVDFTTKYEPEDRALSLQEAFYISGLNGQDFHKLFKAVKLCSNFVKAFFAQIGLQLWDLKWEFAKTDENLIVVDTIDTDSIRVTMNINGNFIHFNKQSIRDYYIKFHPDWIEAIGEAKLKAKKTGVEFQQYLYEKFPVNPAIKDEFLDIQRDKLEAIYNFITGSFTSGETEEALHKIGLKELEFFNR